MASISDPGHLAVVRATIKELGYDGYDPAITADAIDEQTGAGRAIALVKLGMVERRRGRCAAASARWNEALGTLRYNGADGEATWHARALTGLALCDLAVGTRGAEKYAMQAFVHGNAEQIRLIIAIALYENGDTGTAQAMFTSASLVQDRTVQAAIRTWLTLTGLPPP